MQYDTDDTASVSHLELTSMLDSLGSTLTSATISSFFTRFGKDPLKDELTYEEAIHCLETELGRPDSEKKRLDQEHSEDSISATPVLMAADGKGNEVSLDKLDFSGPSLRSIAGGEGDVPAPAPHPAPYHSQQGSWSPSNSSASTPANEYSESTAAVTKKQVTYSSSSTSDAEEDSSGSSPWTSGTNELVVPGSSPKTKKSKFRRNKNKKKAASASSSSTNVVDDTVERVINVKNCPLCHRPRLNSKAEVDIVTHLAICASQDWNKVDRIVVGNFVTASQAQRKWYTKIISKVSSGDYKLGAVCAILSISSIDAVLTSAVEFGKHHRPEQDDWSIGGRENAGLRQIGYSTLVQGKVVEHHPVHVVHVSTGNEESYGRRSR